MKKVFTLFTIATFCFTAANAQINKGSILLGGNISGNTYNSKTSSSPSSTYKTSGFNFSPTVGVAVKQNLIIGGSLQFGTGKTSSTNNNDINRNSYGVGVFVRKYKQLSKSDFYFLGEADGNVSFSKETIKSSPQFIRKQTSVGIGLTPGIAYAVSKRFHLEAALQNLVSLGYTNTNENGTTSDSFGISTNLSGMNSISFGFRFFIAK